MSKHNVAEDERRAEKREESGFSCPLAIWFRTIPEQAKVNSTKVALRILSNGRRCIGVGFLQHYTTQCAWLCVLCFRCAAFTCCTHNRGTYALSFRARAQAQKENPQKNQSGLLCPIPCSYCWQEGLLAASAHANAALNPKSWPQVQQRSCWASGTKKAAGILNWLASVAELREAALAAEIQVIVLCA